MDPTGGTRADIPIGWDGFIQSIDRARRLVAAAAPSDPLDRAEGDRYVARLARWAIGQALEDRNPATPALNWDVVKIGGDNPDYLYGSTAISATHDYRIHCRPNDAHRVGIGTYYGALGVTGGLRCGGYVTTETLTTERDGTIVIHVSANQQPGNWLPAHPDTVNLLIRETVLDRFQHRPATFEITRTDDRPRRDQTVDEIARIAAGFRNAGRSLEGIVTQFLAWSERFASRPNTIAELDADLLSQAQGDASTRYYNGYFELSGDQALLVTFKPPPCDYWNFQLTNHWLESLDFAPRRTHVNMATARSGPDGTVQIAVARQDPGVVNWLDSMGHSRGGLVMRLVNATQQPEIAVQVIQPG